MTSKTWWRVFWGALLLVPVIYLTHQAILEKQRKQEIQESKLFFDELCKKEAGEFIYKTVDDVEGVARLRSRDYSKDYFDEARKGNYPEDPFGHIGLGWGGREGRAFLYKSQNGDYVPTYSIFESVRSGDETATSGQGNYVRYSSFNPKTGEPGSREFVTTLKSRYGYTYRGLERSDLRRHGIIGGETVIIDLKSEETLAVFRGFVKTSPSYDVCPKGDGRATYPFSIVRFVTNVLKPLPRPGH